MRSALAPAKLNLALHITGMRSDGYHVLSSLVVLATDGDRIGVAPADTLTLEITGPFAHQLAADATDHNLVLRTARLLQRHYGRTEGARIRLDKQLPVASGIGGGSSDAATAAQLLCALWGIHPQPDELAQLLLPLGADIPVCLGGTPALVEGIGETLRPLASLPPLHLLLVNPGVAISTPEVFRRYDRGTPTPDAPLLWPEGGFRCPPSLVAWLHTTRNALEPAAFDLTPALTEVRAQLTGQKNCLFARMSGSGATCFGIFSDREAAIAAGHAITSRYPHWWVLPTGLK